MDAQHDDDGPGHDGPGHDGHGDGGTDVSADPGTGIDPLAALEASSVGKAVLVDVRTDDEWAAGHVASALHLPLDRLEGSGLDDDRTIITICGGGGRATRAAGALRDRGLDARPMTGGMRAWAAEGLPVESGPA